MNIPITGHTKLTALLGSPVTHSISPLMHNEGFRHHGLDYVYLCFDVTQDTLPEVVHGLTKAGIRGFNLTMPNKNRMVSLVDELAPAAQLIGAVNTVVQEDGHLTGHNTDGVGFMRSLHSCEFAVAQSTMTVLGAGGAATAICAQAALDGIGTLYIAARTTSRHWNRMMTLVEHINQQGLCKAILVDMQNTDLLRDAISQSDLLVNATSVGMAPQLQACPIPHQNFLHSDLFVADIIYNPKETQLLAMARSLGCRTLNGLPMLLYQGAEAFRLWTGKPLPVELIREKYFS
ncbi:MAG: shikimate dehydrogenase [Lachnospiraceae bacterium]